MADKPEERGILEIAGISWQVDAVALVRDKHTINLGLVPRFIYYVSITKKRLKLVY